MKLIKIKKLVLKQLEVVLQCILCNETIIGTWDIAKKSVEDFNVEEAQKYLEANHKCKAN